MVTRVKPQEFTAHGAPPFVESKLSAYKSFDGSGRPWYETRQVIEPRIGLIHTNGAENEGTIESAINWGNRSASNTHPHYQVDRFRAAKLVPTDRRAIGNATVDSYQGTHGDISFFSLVIETADEGWPTPNRPDAPGGTVGFIGDQVEMIAQIMAYESIVHPKLVLATPTVWYGQGWGTHTDPFGYPYTTIVKGKPCPGLQKKIEFIQQVLPLARVIRAEWTGVERKEDMEILDIAPRIYSTRPSDNSPGMTDGPLAPFSRRKIIIPFADASLKTVQVNIKVIPQDGPDVDLSMDPGWLRAVCPRVLGDARVVHSDINWDQNSFIAFSVVEVNCDGGAFYIENGPSTCDVLIDLKGMESA